MRQVFELNDTGTAGDTGAPAFGVLHQVRWNPTGDTGALADTGPVLALDILPRSGDSGDGWNIVTMPAASSLTNFVIAPRQPTHDVSGAIDLADTGTPVSPAPILFHGDRLRLRKIAPAGSNNPLQGRLYAWFKSDD